MEVTSYFHIYFFISFEITAFIFSYRYLKRQNNMSFTGVWFFITKLTGNISFLFWLILHCKFPSVQNQSSGKVPGTLVQL